ncbi:MAG TPA: STAS domain-containing protein [Herpetosiphonaceae bacterium]
MTHTPTLDAAPNTIGDLSSRGTQVALDMLTTVVGTIDQGVLVVTAESEAIFCNKQFLNIWQIPDRMAADNKAMMEYVLDQLAEPEYFVSKIITINSDPDAVIRDEVPLKDGRVIERFSQPSRGTHYNEIHRVWCFLDITNRKRAETDLLRQQRLVSEQQDRIIQMQQAALAELSTPLIPISDSLLVMPLIGAVDTVRASNILEALLQGVSDHRPKAVIIDITGVAAVDSQVASSLVQAAQAVRLLGATAIITGIRPDVAQTLVSLGIQLNNFKSFGTLQDGIAYAQRF